MMRWTGSRMPGRLWLFLLPLVLALTVDSVPRFVHAACLYYSCGTGTTVEIQASTNGGYTWVSDSITVQGYPGQPVQVRFRTVLHVVSGQLQAWSYSFRHDASALESLGGTLDITYANHAYTDVDTVLNPFLIDTTIRTDAQGVELGFTQGVIVDDTLGTMLGPTLDFVTAEASYDITMPSGTCAMPLTLVDDLGDGRPPIGTLTVQNVEGVAPCRCGFTLYLSN